MDLMKMFSGKGDNSFLTEMLLEKAKPMLMAKLPEFEEKIKTQLKAVDLLEGETHFSYVITEHQNRIVIVLAAFNNKTIVRAISAKTFDVAVSELLENLLQ